MISAKETDLVEHALASLSDRVLCVILEFVAHPRGGVGKEMIGDGSLENFCSKLVPFFGDGGRQIRVVDGLEIVQNLVTMRCREVDGACDECLGLSGENFKKLE